MALCLLRVRRVSSSLWQTIKYDLTLTLITFEVWRTLLSSPAEAPP